MRRKAINPINPLPNMAQVEGSGTDCTVKVPAASSVTVPSSVPVPGL